MKLSSTETEPTVQTPFSDFLEGFNHKLKSVFHEKGNIDQMSVTRGLAPKVLSEIMSTNPLAVSIPVQYGGRGGLIHENLALLSAASYESLPLSLTFGINSALFIQPVAKYANNDVKASVFSRFIENQAMGGLMITEPDFGSDALGMQTSYNQTGDNYNIRGTKHWAGLTGMADFWLLTARQATPDGNLKRDIDFFICDTSQPNQQIKVVEYFENLGLYQIPYGRNQIDVSVPANHRLIPHTNGIQMMLDLLHRSRMHFPGMGLGFIKRMLDEAIEHCQKRVVGNKLLTSYDQVQQRLMQLQASFTACSAFCSRSTEMASIKNDLTSFGMEANIIKAVTSDLMQEAAQSLLQMIGAKGYKLNHIAGRSVVDSRPFQIFEGSNDMLYSQISESLIKLMKTAREKSLIAFLKDFTYTSRAVDHLKEMLNFDMDPQMPQRKLVEMGRLISRIVTMEFVIALGDKGFRTDLIEGAISSLKQEINTMLSTYHFKQSTLVVEHYNENSSWLNLVKH